jgi:hypothetical protein
VVSDIRRYRCLGKAQAGSRIQVGDEVKVVSRNAECRTQHFRWVGLIVELIEWKIVTIILHRTARSIFLDNPLSQLFDSKVNESF